MYGGYSPSVRRVFPQCTEGIPPVYGGYSLGEYVYSSLHSSSSVPTGGGGKEAEIYSTFVCAFRVVHIMLHVTSCMLQTSLGPRPLMIP